LREILLEQLPPEPTPITPPEGGEITFQNTIKPIFESKCGACHSTSNSLKGLDLTTYEGIMQGSESGAVIITGDPENSLIIIIQTSEDGHFAQLTSDELALLEQWIADGAPEE
jgi:uncharacterized membrane protein